MERTIRTILRVKVKMGGKKFLKKRRNRYDWKIVDDDSGRKNCRIFDGEKNKIDIGSINFTFESQKNSDFSCKWKKKKIFKFLKSILL